MDATEERLERAGGERRGRMALALAVVLAVVLAGAAACGVACAGQRAAGAAGRGTQGTETGEQGGATASTAGQRVTLDRVVAVVNGELILESDLDAEARMGAFQPLGERTTATREELTERLIDRDLILQQMPLQPQAPVSSAEVDAELAVLRKSIPECAAYRCETDSGWERFVVAQGFTVGELEQRWKQRMEVLRFVEARFRMGIRISPAEVEAYYKTTLVPAYAAEKASAPPEASVADRIQEILLQQEVDKLLDDWLTSLRAEGSVRILKAGEDLP